MHKSFMSIGTEQEVQRNDIGQPRFRLVFSRQDPAQEPLYITMGSLVVPNETAEQIASVEALVMTGPMFTILQRAVAQHYPTATYGELIRLHYVPRGKVTGVQPNEEEAKELCYG